MSKHEDSIRAGAQDLLEPGEEIVAALVVSPRGSGTAMAGGLAVGEIGARWSGKNVTPAKASSSKASPRAFLPTP